jgi:hypothetical protein
MCRAQHCWMIGVLRKSLFSVGSPKISAKYLATVTAAPGFSSDSNSVTIFYSNIHDFSQGSFLKFIGVAALAGGLSWSSCEDNKTEKKGCCFHFNILTFCRHP